MNKVKVLHIISGGVRREGISSTQLEFFKHMDLEKFEIIVAAVHDDEQAMIDEFEENACRVIRFPDRREHTVRYFFALLKTMKEEKIDIVHVHGSSAVMSIELLAAKIAGVKVRIAHSHNTKAEQVKADRMLRPLFNRLYTNGFACGIDAGKWMFGDRPFTVIYNGRDFSRFNYNEELRSVKREMLHLSDKIVVGHVGRMNHQKNHAFLLNVFHEFQKTHSNAVLYLMGDGALRESIQKQAVDLGIADKVILAGSVSDVADRLQAMDIMVLPSRFEGLPTVVLEWQAEGLPCLLSDVITRECAPSNLAEYASLEDSPKAWAEKMEQMLNRFTDRAAQAERGTAALKTNGFDIDKASKQMEKIYWELMREPNKADAM